MSDLRWRTIPWERAFAVLALLVGPSCTLPPDEPADAAAAAESANEDLASDTKRILSTYCSRCHGVGSPGYGGMNYVEDLTALVARGKVIPGDPDRSLLLARIESEEMPPFGDLPTLEERSIIRRWIQAGAPTGGGAPLVTYADIERAVLDDLARLPADRARRARYLTAAHAINAGASRSELSEIARSVNWAVNSLSRSPTLRAPLQVNADLGIYRVFLDDYEWSASSWNELMERYPYVALAGVPGSTTVPAPVIYSAAGREIAAKTGTRLAISRVDWFARTALFPPLYYDFLDIPSTLQQHERDLGLSTLANIENRRVLRAGFSESGVSFHNRVIERHALPTGAFWISYDFASDFDKSNIFLNPLGPGGGFGFVQAGGEIIYNLPNGLQAYSLINARGRRIDVGPTNIVYDATRPPGEIIAGISCMGCHRDGILRKTNEVTRDTVSATLPSAALDAVTELYSRQPALDAAYREDSERVQRVLTAMDAATPPAGSTANPFQMLADRYDLGVDGPHLAAELGLRAADWATFVAGLADQRLKATLLPTTSGATLKRPVVEDVFPLAVRALPER